ncbi:unnamed protein product [Musa textilis]
MICSLKQLHSPLLKARSPSSHVHKREYTLETMASRCSTVMLALLPFSLAMIARSTSTTPRIKIATAIFVGHAINNKAGCAGPCQAAGHHPDGDPPHSDPTDSGRGSIRCCITA